MDSSSLIHCKLECQYHIVFSPKFCSKKLYDAVKDDVREIIRTLCKYKKVEIIAEAVCAVMYKCSTCPVRVFNLTRNIHILRVNLTADRLGQLYEMLKHLFEKGTILIPQTGKLRSVRHFFQAAEIPKLGA